MKPTSSNIYDSRDPNRPKQTSWPKRMGQNASLFVKAAFFASAAGGLLTMDDPGYKAKTLGTKAEALFSGTLPSTSLEKSLSPEERQEILRTQISKLIELRTIEHGDTPDGLAAKAGLAPEEFQTLNRFLGYEVSKTLRIGDSFVFPQDREQVRGYLSLLKKINHSAQLKDAVESGKSVRELKNISPVNIFPSEVECVGMEETLLAMAYQQEKELDPFFPSEVDPRIQTVPSCANYIKYMFIHACNLKYYSESQRKVLLTEWLDAWLIPKRFYADFGYTQHFRELMDDFDFARIQDHDPIRPDKKEEYYAKVRELFFTLKDGKVPLGSLVPLFFQYSHAKGKVAAAYAGVPLQEKHMNTHQTIFVRNATMTFSASDVPTIVGWVRIPFGEKSPHFLKLSSRFQAQSVLVENLKQAILQNLNEEKNPTLFKDDTPEKKMYRTIFQKAMEGGKIDGVTLKNFGTTISKNSLIVGTVIEYAQANYDLKLMQDELNWYKKPVKPIVESRNIVDLLANFIINRADFNGSFSEDFKNHILAGMKRYPDFFDVTINGVKIDLATELQNIEKGQALKIIPTDTITLFGPMMVDGEIRSTHPDPRRQKVMNGRTRFALEFLTTSYLPTELAVPNPGVIKSRYNTISTIASGLAFHEMYALRKDETIESVLMERIPEFEGIAADDPKRKAKIFWHYQYQLRGLMLDGFMRSENELNPSSTVPNRAIPYYNRESVIALWPKHMAAYYEAKKTEQATLESDILEFPIIGGGGITTPKGLFSRLSERIIPNEARYPILRQIRSFDEFQKLYFIDQAYRRARKDARSENVFAFFRNAEHNRTLFFSVEDLAKLVKDITSLSSLEIPSLKPNDEETIDSLVENVQTAALIKNTLFIETYGGGVLKWRQSIKWARGKHNNSVGIYQLRFEDLKDADIHNGVLQTYRNSSPEPLPQPTRQDILEAVWYALSSEVLERGKEFFKNDANGLGLLYEDALKLARIQKIFSQSEASKEEVFEVYSLLREVSRMDIMGERPFLGNYVDTELLDSKYHKHAEKIIYWLQKIGIPMENLVENEELRFQYARTLILVNNQSEEPTLYMYSTNYLLRILESLEVPIETDDVYVTPNSLYGELKQVVAGQISFKRDRYFEHFDRYLKQYEHRLTAEKYLKKMGDPTISDDRILSLEKAQKILRGYLSAMQQNPEKTNAITLEIFANPELQAMLRDKKLSTYPFVTDREIQSSDPFRKSAFNYISKVMKAVAPKKAPQPGALQNFYNEQIQKIIPAGLHN